jgi:hypothetical protein
MNDIQRDRYQVWLRGDTHWVLFGGGADLEPVARVAVETPGAMALLDLYAFPGGQVPERYVGVPVWRGRRPSPDELERMVMPAAASGRVPADPA